MKSVRSLTLALVALATAAAAVSSRGAFVPKTHVNKILQIRGGAGPVDPQTVGKVASAVAIAHGTLTTVAPKLVNEQFGVSEEDNDFTAQYIIRNIGVGALSLGLMGYCLFFEGTSIRRAVQASNVIWIYEMLRNIFSGDATQAGYSSMSGLKFCVALFAFTTFAMTQDYADTVIKAMCVFWGLSGLQCIAAPSSASASWKFNKDKLTPFLKVAWQEFGIFLVSTSVFSGSIVFADASNTQALGYATIPWVLWLLYGFLNGTYKEFGMNEGVMWFWLLYHAAIAASTLI